MPFPYEFPFIFDDYRPSMTEGILLGSSYKEQWAIKKLLQEPNVLSMNLIILFTVIRSFSATINMILNISNKFTIFRLLSAIMNISINKAFILPKLTITETVDLVHELIFNLFGNFTTKTLVEIMNITSLSTKLLQFRRTLSAPLNLIDTFNRRWTITSRSYFEILNLTDFELLMGGIIHGPGFPYTFPFLFDDYRPYFKEVLKIGAPYKKSWEIKRTYTQTINLNILMAYYAGKFIHALQGINISDVTPKRVIGFIKRYSQILVIRGTQTRQLTSYKIFSATVNISSILRVPVTWRRLLLGPFNLSTSISKTIISFYKRLPELIVVRAGIGNSSTRLLLQSVGYIRGAIATRNTWVKSIINYFNLLTSLHGIPLYKVLLQPMSLVDNFDRRFTVYTKMLNTLNIQAILSRPLSAVRIFNHALNITFNRFTKWSVYRTILDPLVSHEVFSIPSTYIRRMTETFNIMNFYSKVYGALLSITQNIIFVDIINRPWTNILNFNETLNMVVSIDRLIYGYGKTLLENLGMSTNTGLVASFLLDLTDNITAIGLFKTAITWYTTLIDNIFMSVTYIVSLGTYVREFNESVILTANPIIIFIYHYATSFIETVTLNTNALVYKVIRAYENIILNLTMIRRLVPMSAQLLVRVIGNGYTSIGMIGLKYYAIIEDSILGASKINEMSDDDELREAS